MRRATQNRGLKAASFGLALTLIVIWLSGPLDLPEWRRPGLLPSSSAFLAASSSADKWPSNLRPPSIAAGVHPIEALLAQGEERFVALKERQSRTLQEAVREYRRRYGRAPPKGFEGWWAYAQRKGLVLVDEFDTIHRNLEPFWGLSPAQIDQRRKDLLASTKSDRLMSITIRDGIVDDEPGPASSKTWDTNKVYHLLFSDFSAELPDLNFLLNLNDQPMVFVSYEERQRLIDAGRRGVFAPDNEEIPPSPELLYQTHGLGFEDLREACHPVSPARQYTTDLLGEDTYPLLSQAASSYRLPLHQGGFLYNPSLAGDICQNPALQRLHGNFIKPELRVRMQRNRLYPVFSWSTYRASSDVTIPTNYRWQWGPADTDKWENMVPGVAWRGTLTGAYPDTQATRNSQRHRLMLHTQDQWGRTPVLAFDNVTGEYGMASMRMERGKGWLNVGNVAWNYNRKTQAEKEINAMIPPVESLTNQQRGKYKILLDVDGWGWSARYRELLRTTSAVMKATVFHEHYSDWLIPWYHYIPVSYDYSDLYSILLYFFGHDETGHQAHDEPLRAMAERSAEWAESQAGWELQKVYMYRLSLEWARICSEDRASMDYTG